MLRVRVNSENLASVGYDADTGVLEIEFRSGRLYQYFGVPPSVFNTLMTAPSKGAFFVARIKDVYAFRRMS